MGYLVKLYGARRASERAVLKAEYEAGASINYAAKVAPIIQGQISHRQRDQAQLDLHSSTKITC